MMSEVCCYKVTLAEKTEKVELFNFDSARKELVRRDGIRHRTDGVAKHNLRGFKMQTQ